MSGLAGYNTHVKSGGTPTLSAVTPLEYLGDGIYRIADPVKRVISTSNTIRIFPRAGGGDVTANAINYLEGVFYFDTPPSPELDAEIHYIPLSYIGGTNEYNLDLSGDILDDSSFHSATETNGGYRSKAYGLGDASLSFSRYDDLLATIKAKKMDEEALFVRINPGGGKVFISGWYRIETVSASGDVGALEEEAVTLQLDGGLEGSFSYIYDYTEAEGLAASEAELMANYFPWVDYP